MNTPPSNASNGGNDFICKRPCLQSRHRNPASISTPQPAQQRGNTNSLTRFKNSIHPSLNQRLYKARTTPYFEGQATAPGKRLHFIYTIHLYNSPLSCSRSFRREYRRRVRSLETAVCNAVFAPTSKTFSLALVTAVYNKLRCSMI